MLPAFLAPHSESPRHQSEFAFSQQLYNEAIQRSCRAKGEVEGKITFHSIFECAELEAAPREILSKQVGQRMRKRNAVKRRMHHHAYATTFAHCRGSRKRRMHADLYGMKGE